MKELFKKSFIKTAQGLPTFAQSLARRAGTKKVRDEVDEKLTAPETKSVKAAKPGLYGWNTG